MESVNTSKASSRVMQQDQSSKERRKLIFIITFAVIFSLILGSIITVFAVIKHDIEAEGLSANPSEAIHTVCSLTPYNGLSYSSLSDDQIIGKTKTINPTKIFTLSLSVAIRNLKDLISTTRDVISQAKKNSRTLAALRDCESLFKDSMRLLNKTMQVMDQIDPDKNVFKEKESMTRILLGWMTNATENFDRCLNGTDHRGLNTSGDNDTVRTRMKMETERSSCRRSTENSLTILVKMDEILELFDPRFGSVLATLLLSTYGYGISVGVFCLQYSVLGIPFVLVLRLY